MGGAGPEQELAFVQRLNSRLPKTRVIGHGLIRDEAGRVLLCELTYKRAWDMPGGVVEPSEPPRLGCQREVAEEFGASFTAQRLIAVNWLSPWRGWDDALVFLYDLGVHPADVVSSFTLQPHEIVAVHWCALEEIPDRAPAATARLLARVLGAGLDGGFAGGQLPDGVLYLEDGADPDWS